MISYITVSQLFMSCDIISAEETLHDQYSSETLHVCDNHQVVITEMTQWMCLNCAADTEGMFASTVGRSKQWHPFCS